MLAFAVWMPLSRTISSLQVLVVPIKGLPY